jgi:hypothetical protein
MHAYVHMRLTVHFAAFLRQSVDILLVLPSMFESMSVLSQGAVAYPTRVHELGIKFTNVDFYLIYT